MKKMKRVMCLLLCFVLVFGMTSTMAAEKEDQTENETGKEQTVDTSDLVEGTDADILVSDVSVSGSQAGHNVTIRFSVNAANASKRYVVSQINKIVPVINDAFPFETSNEAYKVISGTSTGLTASYTFVAKDNLETGYYPVAFNVVYNRKATLAEGTDPYADNDYYVTKNINVKINGKKETTTTEATAGENDISIAVKSAPKGTYGQNCKVAFSLRATAGKIKSVAPVVADNFPFETQGDAYKTVTTKGAKNLSVSYTFKVRKDAATGYQPVSFLVVYEKNGQTFTATKSVNVSLTGKKEKKESSGNGNKSTPRVMVTGYSLDVKQVKPNQTFQMTLHVKNNAKRAVSNVKLTLSTGDGEFIPISGAATAYIDSIAAGAEKDIKFAMQAASSLQDRSYTITVKSEYEDGAANAFTGEDSLSVPVTLDDRVKITEIVPPEDLAVDGTSDLTFTINNIGTTVLNNVTVNCSGEGFTAEESIVGNIAAGAQGYATITLTGTDLTEDAENNCKISISYENSRGEVKTLEETATVMVMSPMEDMGDDAAIDGDATQKKSNPFLWLAIVFVVVAVVVVVIMIRKKKKQKRIREEEELMDDDL